MSRVYNQNKKLTSQVALLKAQRATLREALKPLDRLSKLEGGYHHNIINRAEMQTAAAAMEATEEPTKFIHGRPQHPVHTLKEAEKLADKYGKVTKAMDTAFLRLEQLTGCPNEIPLEDHLRELKAKADKCERLEKKLQAVVSAKDKWKNRAVELDAAKKDARLMNDAFLEQASRADSLQDELDATRGRLHKQCGENRRLKYELDNHKRWHDEAVNRMKALREMAKEDRDALKQSKPTSEYDYSTKGPWHYEKEQVLDSENRVVAVVAKRGETEVETANGELLASAPAMRSELDTKTDRCEQLQVRANNLQGETIKLEAKLDAKQSKPVDHYILDEIHKLICNTSRDGATRDVNSVRFWDQGEGEAFVATVHHIEEPVATEVPGELSKKAFKEILEWDKHHGCARLIDKSQPEVSVEEILDEPVGCKYRLDNTCHQENLTYTGTQTFVCHPASEQERYCTYRSMPEPNEEIHDENPAKLEWVEDRSTAGVPSWRAKKNGVIDWVLIPVAIGPENDAGWVKVEWKEADWGTTESSLKKAQAAVQEEHNRLVAEATKKGGE